MNIAALNKKRNLVRYSSIAVAAVDLVAIVMIMAGMQLPGIVLGMAALVGGAVYKRKGKKAYQEECCRLQTEKALGLRDLQYLGESKETEEFVRNTHLLPTSATLVQPLLMHAASGAIDGGSVRIAEATIGCYENNKKQPTYSSGVMVRVTLDKA